ncbi:hypothetical protein PoB_003001800 [Plakobranchus ocellatus]|uniref:Uncharacterized protein n=1 Tax=Plakobranchus ocellatus TaxID=259542 RepID=A0AAV4A9T1_9GAST|nr:hypothetical protein PoB_003001800 [Plakobranchus ocellatus]
MPRKTQRSSSGQFGTLKLASRTQMVSHDRGFSHSNGVGGTVDNESALRSAGILLSWVRSPSPTPWPEGGPESLRSPDCGHSIHKTKSKHLT